MRPSNKSRSRNKPGNNGHNNGGNGLNNNPRRSMGNIVNRVFESAGPDGKVRGTPQQIIDKYQALARDAQVAGDRVAAENYLQHSEHYSRLLGEAQRSQNEQQRFVQEREDRFGQEREDRFGQDREEQPTPSMRAEEAPAPLSHAPAMPQPTSSALATIEPEDSDYFSGPIETPEGRARRQPEPAPVRSAPVQAAPVQPAPMPVFDPVPAAVSPAQPEYAPPPVADPDPQPVPPVAEAGAAPAPAKRPRVRRKAKVEPDPEAKAESRPEAEAQPIAPDLPFEPT